jgi:hypothetical protein
MKTNLSRILISAVSLMLLITASCSDDDETGRDTTPPVITMNGSSQVYVDKGTTYTDAGATALDETDGDLTASIQVKNLVDPNVTGTYHVTYNVSDKAGNKAQEVVRTVIVMIF